MIISNKLNRFLRAIISEFRDQLVEGQDGAKEITNDSVKTMLCYTSQLYPKDEFGIPFSFTKITNKEACDLAEYIFKSGGERGFTFSSIEQEWDRIIQQIRN